MPKMLNLTTDLGELDLTFDPAGGLDGFVGWRQGASRTTLGDGVLVWAAALDDVIASKLAANRAKDRAQLPYLESLRDEIERAATPDGD